MRFHDLKHTQDVFFVATEIALNSEIPHQDILTLQLAALFHDTGYLFDYIGHEEKSKLTAANFLLQEGCPENLIAGVVQTIDATKMPQHPQTDIQRILCDADLFHLAQTDYADYADRLRAEWASNLQKQFSDQEWRVNNLKFMQQHQYFTTYASELLEPGKQQNLRRLFLHELD